MKVKLTIFFFSYLFLWGSLSSYGQQSHSDHAHVVKQTAEHAIALAPALSFTEQDLDEAPTFLPNVFTFFALYTPAAIVLYTTPVIHTSTRIHIIFRVLRN